MISAVFRSPKWRPWLATFLGLVLIGGIALWPVETRQGIDFNVSSRRIRLYEKAADFISRDLQTRRLLQDIVVNTPPGEAQALVIFKWVTEHVRPTPEGFPIIDDHPLHIIIRGYGAEDQRTEAFELLASYSGMASTRMRLKSPQGNDGIHIALTEIHGTSYMFDVVHNIIFRDDSGALVPAKRVIAEPSLVHMATHGLNIRGVPYEDFFSHAELNADFSRMEMQKPWQRLRIEVLKLIGTHALR